MTGKFPRGGKVKILKEQVSDELSTNTAWGVPERSADKLSASLWMPYSLPQESGEGPRRQHLSIRRFFVKG